MPLVHDAAPAAAVGRFATAAIAALVATAALAGCSESGGDPPVSGAGTGIDVPLRLADCSDWNSASVAEKLGTVDRIEAFAGGPTGSPNAYGKTLPREKGYDLLEGWCGNEFARSFKLYKLYTRAAAFQELAEKLEQQGES